MFSRMKQLLTKPDADETDPALLRKKVELKCNEDFRSYYEVHELLGKGRFGQVKRVVEKNSKKEFAAKSIQVKSKEEREAVMGEIDIMKRLKHARLLQLYDAFSHTTEMTLILELITGGELFERVIDESFDLTETKCQKFMKEICQGVDYIHSRNIIHLDLKPENILCLTRTGFKVKIIDFGLARYFEPNKETRVLFGTPEFVAPEIIAYEPILYSSDMWSVGVICYVLLSGLSPFMGDNDSETFANVTTVKYSYNYVEFKQISEEAKDWISKLLVKDPRKRMTAKDSLNHPWLKNYAKNKRQGQLNKTRLRHFVYRRKWQRAVNAIIALQRMGVVLKHDNDFAATSSATVQPDAPCSSNGL